MSRDFTVKIFGELLRTLQSDGYAFITYADYCSVLQSDNPKSQIRNPKFVILRHDVDALPLNTLRLAQLENSLGIPGTYYFRAFQHGFEEEIIRQIAALGHEIGYHYETIAQVTSQTSGKSPCNSVRNSVSLRVTKKKESHEEQYIYQAYILFIKNLEKLRRIAPVSTICMHGSPLSRYDNRVVWEKYDYYSLDIIGDPYLDIDFNKMAYLTDTGRKWNGEKISMRDKVESQYKFNFKSTQDIIRNIHLLPDKVMLNLHPQRWVNGLIPWIKELIWQNLKNQAKWLLIKIKS
jgi:hypothetical protein